MKHAKKLTFVLLTLGLAFLMAFSAFAATVSNDTTHSYNAYQIFSGTQDAAKPQLGDVEWGSGISSAASIASSHAPAVRGRIPSRSHAPESTPENVSTSRMVASSIPTVMFFASLFGFIMRAFGGFMRGGKR